VLPRPGSVAQPDFPVYETGEIDGNVSVDRRGQHVPLPGNACKHSTRKVNSLHRPPRAMMDPASSKACAWAVSPGESIPMRVDPDQLAKLHLAAPADAFAREARDMNGNDHTHAP
jgi:hypothetical protein